MGVALDESGFFIVMGPSYRQAGSTIVSQCLYDLAAPPFFSKRMLGELCWLKKVFLAGTSSARYCSFTSALRNS